VKRPSKEQERAVPTQERARDTVQLLLEATEQVARRIGFDEATTKEIASVAGVSAGTLYRYFPSKEALLRALLRRQWEVGLQEFGSAIALITPGDFGSVVEQIVRLAFQMVAGRVEALGKMRIETNNLLGLSVPDLINDAAGLVEGALERRRDQLRVEDIHVASIVVVRSVVFLARVGSHDYAELVKSDRYPKEVAAMVRHYLVRPTSPEGAPS
jgi:AcrR family transcriptional regulator